MEAIGSHQGINSAATQVGFNFFVLMSRQGKIRLSEFFQSYTESEKRRITKDIAADILPRAPKMCNIIEKGPYKFVYRRYASLYFVVGVPLGMNELIVLEQIHLFVEALDGYFNSGNVIKNTREKPYQPLLSCLVLPFSNILTSLFLLPYNLNDNNKQFAN